MLWEGVKTSVTVGACTCMFCCVYVHVYCGTVHVYVCVCISSAYLFTTLGIQSQ